MHADLTSPSSPMLSFQCHQAYYCYPTGDLPLPKRFWKEQMKDFSQNILHTHTRTNKQSLPYWFHRWFVRYCSGFIDASKPAVFVDPKHSAALLVLRNTKEPKIYYFSISFKCIHKEEFLSLSSVYQSSIEWIKEIRVRFNSFFSNLKVLFCFLLENLLLLEILIDLIYHVL